MASEIEKYTNGKYLLIAFLGALHVIGETKVPNLIKKESFVHYAY